MNAIMNPVEPPALRRADLQDLSWTDCACGQSVVLALPKGGTEWSRFEPAPDGGAPGESRFQRHVCPKQGAA